MYTKEAVWLKRLTGCGGKRNREPGALPDRLLRRHALGYEAALEPGDLLFIPACWFHSFRHLGHFNANVNYWWKPERSTLNAVAVRQRLIDTVAAAGIGTQPGEPDAEWLRKLDGIITGDQASRLDVL